MPDHRTPMGRPATLVLMVPAGCILATAGDWHLIGTEDGKILKAINRFTNESMAYHQLAALSVPPEEFKAAQAATVEGAGGVPSGPIGIAGPSVDAALATKPLDVPQGFCQLCGLELPPGERMFKYHGYSGDCPVKDVPAR